MFRGHKSEILIARKEPKNIDVEKETTKARQFLAKIAFKAVKEHLLSSQPINTKSVTLKVKRLEEFDMGLKEIEPFLEAWNKWRSFYFPQIENQVKIKTPQQLGMAKAAKEFIEENKMNCDIAIAALFKSYSKRKRVTNLPNFSAIKAFGIEVYDQWYEKVVADIEANIYQEQSL